jgi:hypothetical protein
MRDPKERLRDILEPHHGMPFGERLERALPDWRERKEELRTSAGKFVRFSP